MGGPFRCGKDSKDKQRGPSDGFKQGRDGVRLALKDINVVTLFQEREVIISAFQRESS